MNAPICFHLPKGTTNRQYAQMRKDIVSHCPVLSQHLPPHNITQTRGYYVKVYTPKSYSIGSIRGVMP